MDKNFEFFIKKSILEIAHDIYITIITRNLAYILNFHLFLYNGRLNIDYEGFIFFIVIFQLYRL